MLQGTVRRYPVQRHSSATFSNPQGHCREPSFRYYANGSICILAATAMWRKDCPEWNNSADYNNIPHLLCSAIASDVGKSASNWYLYNYL